MKTSETVVVRVEMGGDIETARRWLRTFCYNRGRCVTVEPLTFIYTGGEESGFRVGLVNYPRFPSDAEAVEALALEIAGALIVECCQKTALVIGPKVTTFVAVDPPGRPK
jgi:hypothetical protein